MNVSIDGVKTMNNEINEINEFLDKNPQLNKFVKYLEKTYGLIVDEVKYKDVYLSYGNGINICSVCYSENVWNKRVNRDTEEYYIRSQFLPTTIKARPNCRTSTSFNGIKNAIKKAGLPNVESINKIVFDRLNDVKELIVLKGRRSDIYKNRYSLSEDSIHSMMRLVISGVPITDLGLVKEIDKVYATWEEVDNYAANKNVVVKEFYKNGVHVIGAMPNGTYIHGIVKLQEQEQYEMEQEFMKIGSLEDYPELVGITTMLKVRNEGRGKNLTRGFIPISDSSTYDADMDVLYIVGNSYTLLGDILWAVVGV